VRNQGTSSNRVFPATIVFKVHAEDDLGRPLTERVTQMTGGGRFGRRQHGVSSFSPRRQCSQPPVFGSNGGVIERPQQRRAEGRAMSTAEAVAYALEAGSQPRAGPQQ
jgi:hypothetical protein